MSRSLPVLSGAQMIRALERLGFTQTRQKGDHVTLHHQDGRRTTVPLHKELARGTMQGVMRQAQINAAELKRAHEHRRPPKEPPKNAERLRQLPPPAPPEQGRER